MPTRRTPGRARWAAILLGPGLAGCLPWGGWDPGEDVAGLPNPRGPRGFSWLEGRGRDGTLDGAGKTPAEAAGPLSLTLPAALLLALENNPSFQVERLRPGISRTEEEAQRAAFDPVFSASAAAERLRDRSNLDGRKENSLSADARLRMFLPTGTTVELGAGASGRSNDDRATSRDWNGDLTVTQSLLRGRGAEVNLARLRQARLDTEISAFELRGAAEALVAQVERIYWDGVLAERSIEIFEKSLEIAEQQVTEVKERIRVGQLAETELSAAEAEAASRREQLIDARGTLAKRRLGLIRLLNPGGGDGAWVRKVALEDKPEMSAVALDGEKAHVETALRERADLNQARLQAARGGIEVVRTRNGLLPRLDLFATIGGSRYASSFSAGPDERGETASYSAGVSLEIPLGNREARARHLRAVLSEDQARAALRNMEQLVQLDVRSAYVDVGTAAERVKATAATRALREKTLATEIEKFRVGKSTTFLVSQARRDLVGSQIAEVEAIVGYRKALIELFRLDGSLLPRRGIRQ